MSLPARQQVYTAVAQGGKMEILAHEELTGFFDLERSVVRLISYISGVRKCPS
jgi:hypothetical protein